MKQDAHIIFLYAPQLRHKRSIRQWLKLLRRYPQRMWRRVLVAWIVSITRSPIVHVAIEYDGAVLNPTYKSLQYFPTSQFVVKYPQLHTAFKVRLRHVIDLDTVNHKPMSCLNTWVKWLTRGMVRTNDCTCIARNLLIQAGYDVPRRVVSPIQLYQWCIQHGFESINLR